MLKHIVMWKFKEHAEGADKATNLLKAKALLDACAGLSPGTHRFEVAIAQPGLEATYDLVLYAEFTDAAALAAYADHPQHVALKPFIGAVREARQCMDYDDSDPTETRRQTMTARTVQKLFDLTGKTALITGGSRGLGLQMAHALGEAGARIMLSSRKAEDLEQAAAELQAAGIDARWIAADCSKEEDTRRLADETLQRMGAVDILVNNAGASWGSPAESHPVEAWDKVMNLNVRGYFILSQHIANGYMIPKKTGRIINIASVAGLNGNPPEMQTLAYNTSKTAVIGFTRTLAAEWGKYDITVNAICPGFFMTKMAAGLIKSLGEEKMAAKAPLGRLGDDEDLKGLTLLYASDAGKHITGQWLAVDGGVSVVLGAA
jgi:NAD(P)-dependent dehydrogenase (short-subunit alcohol dehydrogenase family)